jgi:hypothetical protein
MRMMQVPAHQVIRVVAVRYLRVPAGRSMHVRRLVTAACMLGSASVRVGSAHSDGVLVNVICVDMVKMAVVHVIGVSLVQDGGVPAANPMRVSMPLVHMVFRHCTAPLFGLYPYRRPLACSSGVWLRLAMLRRLTTPV